jgi:uncharacterized Zn-binding protein involved in type VI secretion
MKRLFLGALVFLAAATSATAQSPAARVGDMTSHGGIILPPGASTVFISGMPAARLTDQVACPLVTGVVPHVGGPIVTGSSTVLIGGMPAARVGDTVSETGPPSTIATGATTVIIGP